MTNKYHILIVGDLCCVRFKLLPLLWERIESKDIDYFLTEHISQEQLYEFDYILFYTDMNNRRSWRICEEGFQVFPASLLCERSCILISHFSDQSCYSFDKEVVQEEIETHSIPWIAVHLFPRCSL